MKPLFKINSNTKFPNREMWKIDRPIERVRDGEIQQNKTIEKAAKVILMKMSRLARK